MNGGNAASQASNLDPDVQETVLLAVGGLWGVDYEVHAHAITAQLAGLPNNAIVA